VGKGQPKDKSISELLDKKGVLPGLI